MACIWLLMLPNRYCCKPEALRLTSVTQELHVSLNHKGNKQAYNAVYRTGLGDTTPLVEASSPCLTS